jgi:hypothetical protein
MKARDFDKLIKSRLKELNVPAQNDAWNAFTQHQMEQNGREKAFDEALRKKMHRVRPAFKEKNWHFLEQRLTDIKERKQTIYLSRIMEITAIFLMIFPYYLYTGTSSQEKTALQKGPLAYAKSKEVRPEFYTNHGASHPKTSNTALYKGHSAIITNPSQRATYSGIPVRKDQSYIATLPPLQGMLGACFFDKERIPFKTRMPNKESFIYNDIATPGDLPFKGNAVEGNTELPALCTTVRRVPESEMAFAMGSMELTYRNPGRVKYFITAYATSDINLINTPFDKLYAISSYKKEAVNHSFGITFSGKKARAEWETGLELVQRRYSPESITETFGQGPDYYFETSLKEIQFTMVGIPLLLKYHFIDRNTWNAYFTSSIQANLIMDSRYNIEESLKHGRPTPARYTPEAPRLDEKLFTEGLLHGDALKHNYFITAGFGLGIQKKIFEKTYINGQTSYSHHILSHDIGIGPNKDRIHSISFQLGLKRGF